MIKFLKKILPEFIKKKMDQYLSKKSNYCPTCDSYINKFLPISWSYLKNLDDNGYIHSIFAAETFNIIAYSCPVCGATDRDRLYALYFQNRFKEIDHSRKYSFIEFAPSQGLSKKLISYPFVDYRSADLYMEHVDDIVDITNMPTYQNESTDMFLCSHVLEHVSDDKQAVKELYRILKPGGWGILMAPILLTLKYTYEDPQIVTEADRWKYFGQFDHVRIYAKNDFVNLLKAPGFTVHQLDEKYFGEDAFRKYGIHARSVLYVVEK